MKEELDSIENNEVSKLVQVVGKISNNSFIYFNDIYKIQGPIYVK